jgi:hypothetical protein
MTALRTFEEVVEALAGQFDDTDAQFLTATAGPERFVEAIRELAGDRGGLLLVRGAARSWIANERLARQRVEGWLKEWQGSPIAEAVSTRTTEGALLALRVRPMAMAVRDELRQVEGASIEHLDLAAVRRLDALRELDPDASWEGLSAIELGLLDLGIARRDGDGVAPTVAGMVAFGRRPHLFVPGMRVRYIDEGGERWIEGNARDLVGALLDEPEVLRGVGGSAMAELVVNAVVHRDWSASVEDEPVEIRRDGDRVEVRNPGLFEPRRGPRNPVLAQLLSARDLLRGSGSGRDEVKGWLRQQKARGVTWVGRKGAVRVVVEVAAERARPVPPPPPALAPPAVQRPIQPASMPPAVHRPWPVPPVPPSRSPVVGESDADQAEAVVYQSLHDRQRDVVELLVGGGQWTRRQLQEALGWSRSTMRKVLEGLIAEGRVAPSAEAVRSPFRTYRAM